MSLYLLMVRDGDKGGRGVITLREGDGGVTKDGIAYASRLCRLAPGVHTVETTQWCVVEADRPAKARWPDPEPWNGYPAADDVGAAAGARS